MSGGPRVFLAQQRNDTERPSKNLELLTRVVKSAEGEADFVIFPEGFLSGYRCDESVAKRAVAIPEGIPSKVFSLAKDEGCHIVTGVFEKRGRRLYNTAIMVSPDGRVLRYSKTFLGPREAPIFTQGSDFPVQGTRFGKVGLMICYDAFFPEVARALSLGGADFVFCPSATAKSNDEFELFLPSRAVENGVFVAFVNHAGWREELRMPYFGRSRVIDPAGRELVRAKEYAADVVSATLDPRALKAQRKKRPLTAEVAKQGAGVIGALRKGRGRRA